MDCTLMHKNVPVVDIQIDETGFIAKILAIHDESHLPIGINIVKSSIDRKSLNDWWIGRSIPASRDGIDAALQSLHISVPTLLIDKCYGLSLSDHYWISPKGFGLLWENVNFFQNDFSIDMGEVLFGHEPYDSNLVNLMSPNNTSDGWLKKKWIISDNKRFLLKGGSGPYQQEPYNEVIASTIMQRLGINHVEYALNIDDDKPYSLCEIFVTVNTELMPTWRVIQSSKRPNDCSVFDHFINCCDALRVPGIKDSINRLLVVDYIIANEDRHWSNFGLLRNADTLEMIGITPIYDSGTSLWYSTQRVGINVECKPFKKNHDDQIKLAGDLSWFDINKLNGIESDINDVLSRSEYIDSKRRNDIINVVTQRMGNIERTKEKA